MSAIRRLSLRARPGDRSGTAWAGRGEGDVRTSTEPGSVRFHEIGRFRPDGSDAALAFRNVYRWGRRDGAIALYHERFGAKASVWLFDLVAHDHVTLVCRQPHQCLADEYQARLSLTATGLTLDWWIRGPHKNEHLHYAYSY